MALPSHYLWDESHDLWDTTQSELHIQVDDFASMSQDKTGARRNFIAHEHGEGAIRGGGIFNAYLQ